MKKGLSLILVLALIASLAACTKSPSLSPDVSGDSPTPTQNNLPSITPGPSAQQPLPPETSVGVDPISEWGDPVFEKLVRAALGVSNADEVSYEATAAIKKLSIMPKDGKVEVKIDDGTPVLVEADTPMKTLEDILRFNGLTELEVGYAENLGTLDIIWVATGMLALPLESLTIVNAGIEEAVGELGLGLLPSMASLKTLNISGNKITDISALANLPSLETLDVSGNPLEDASQVDLFKDKGVNVIN